MLKRSRPLFWIITAGVALGVGIVLYQVARPSRGRTARLQEWLNNPSAHPEWGLRAGSACGNAPFLFPTEGFIGYLWDDSFQLGHRHQGIDIFGGTGVGKTPVVSAYPGYLTRLAGWKSAVIVRVPSDPLHPGRQIWLYYTHMADPAGHSYILPKFPPGTSEVRVEAGTLLGYQGDYTGDPNSPTGVHLHFSVVRDDGRGGFLNELNIDNTYDPSPYLGLPLNSKAAAGPVTCEGGSGPNP